MDLTNSEKRVIGVFRLIAVFEAIIFAIVYGICLKLPPAKDIFLSYCLIASIVIAIHLTLFFIKGNKFLLFMQKLVSRIGKDNIKGDWDLVIEYDGINGSDVSRYGPCKIEISFLGLKIYGDKIYDSETKKVEVDSWVAEKADIFYYDNKEILFYQYVTYDNDPNNPTKLGIVNAEKVDENKYEGIFQDYKVDSGKIIREGFVKLTRSRK